MHRVYTIQYIPYTHTHKYRPLTAGFSGVHTGQSGRTQVFQWEMICLDEAQWGTKMTKTIIIMKAN